MRFIRVSALLFSAILIRAQDPGSEVNVNSRYTVESVDVSGVGKTKLSKTLQDDLQRLVGQKFNQDRVAELARRIKDELPNRTVSPKVTRGDKPDQVKIVFVIARRQNEHFELSAPTALYDSRQGWSGELDATINIKSSSITFGVVSDANAELARYAGINARYENKRLGTDRARLAFIFESYHEQWNAATIEALEDAPDVPGIYRWRQNFEPLVTLIPARDLKLTAGASFQRLQTQFPAAHIEAANAVVITLRYDRLVEDSSPNKHRLGAGYSLRAATRALDSDFVYARHWWDFRYRLARGNNVLSTHFTSGLISGRPPLFERFVLGNAQTLRGWNKFDVAPLGGTRIAHNSVDYRYRIFRIFYDVGADWNQGQDATAKHSLGLGVKLGDFSILMGFPVKTGRADPILMAGVNF